MTNTHPRTSLIADGHGFQRGSAEVGGEVLPAIAAGCFPSCHGLPAQGRAGETLRWLYLGVISLIL